MIAADGCVEISQAREIPEKLAGELGFEPRQHAPEACVLPLHYSPERQIKRKVASVRRQGNRRGRWPLTQ
jgi:hypothetical protein